MNIIINNQSQSIRSITFKDNLIYIEPCVNNKSLLLKMLSKSNPIFLNNRIVVSQFNGEITNDDN